MGYKEMVIFGIIMTDNNWIVYTKSNCLYCDKVKELLKEENDKLYIDCDKFIKTNRDKFLNVMKNKTGIEIKTFPIVILNNEYIGGYNETKEYIEQMNLTINDDF